MSVTLKQVAELAGVSIGTASQALSQRQPVASKTRARVLDAARTLGYPIPSVGSVAGKELSVVGMLLKHDMNHPIEVNPFYSHVQAGVERECRQRNINLMYAQVEVDESNRPVIWPALIREKQIDGLLLIGTFIEEQIDFVRRHVSTPIVLVDSYAPNYQYDTVLIDNEQGTRAMITHLIEQGHRHIALMGYNQNSPPSFQERHAAYLATLRQHGITDIYVEESFHSTSAAYEATGRLLDQFPQVTAIFGCMDLAAIGAFNAVRDRGLRVPDDVSIAGFDNIDLAAEMRPALTTVHVHKTWMGAIGMRCLIERAQNPDQPKTTTRIATRLVVRDSVADLAARP